MPPLSRSRGRQKIHRVAQVGVDGATEGEPHSRGQAHRVTFTADKVGIFGIECSTHRPSMSGELIVMPKR